MPFRPLFRRLFLCTALIAACGLITVFYPAPSPVHADNILPQVFIEEIAWAGSTLSTADEWIELANLSDATATIAGWSLHGMGESSRTIFLPADAVIPPHATYLIANYPETDTKSSLAVSVQLATTTVSISNSALDITLMDTAGVIIDRAGDDHAPLAGSSSPHASMIRVATSSGDVASSWMTANTTINLKPDLTDRQNPSICWVCAMSTDPAHPDGSEGVDPPIVTLSDPVIEDTTSSIPDIIPPIEAATSASDTTPVIDTAITTSTPPDPIPTPPIIIPPPPPPCTGWCGAPLHIILNEVVSNPSEGHEWVELKISETAVTATDRVLELWDAAGKFTTIPAHTALTAPGYLVVTLATSRLNNGGDDLSVRESGGSIIELTRIPALDDGIAWAKNDAGSWTETDQLTPGAANTFPAPVVTSMPTIPIATPVTVAPSINTSTVQSSINTGSNALSAVRLHLMLNEAMPNPSAGKEWVELRMDETDATATDRVLELWDGSGKMVTIPQGTPMSPPDLLLVTLPSARLNNGGDHLSLRETGGGIVIDETEIPALKKGVAWARDASGSWTDADPTPGTQNSILSSITDSVEESASTPAISHSTISTSSTHPIAMPKKSSAYKPATASTDPNRVRLVGTVGSVPRLLGSTHGFILLGEDGRAAIVYLPTHLNTPNFGSTVRVMGTLGSTERQLELRMKASDVWMTIATSTPPQPRTVDFLSPGVEDAWALVAVTGTVKSVGTKSLVIDADAVDVAVSIPSAVGYRTKRLVPGDQVRVMGLLDPRKEDATILARIPEDIELIHHAPESVTAPTDQKHSASPLFPDWAPFGAAAGAIGATGGGKRLIGFLKRKKLEAIASKAE